VAEDLHGDSGRNAEVFEQRRGCVSQVVQPDGWQLGLPRDALEGPGEASRLDGIPGLGDEHQIVHGARGGRAPEDAHASLVDQRVVGDAEQRQDAATGRGFDRAELKLVPGAEELLADTQGGVVEIDGGPVRPRTSPRRSPYSSRTKVYCPMPSEHQALYDHRADAFLAGQFMTGAVWYAVQ
jgi:hypothetical protein